MTIRKLNGIVSALFSTFDRKRGPQRVAVGRIHDPQGRPETVEPFQLDIGRLGPLFRQLRRRQAPKDGGLLGQQRQEGGTQEILLAAR